MNSHSSPRAIAVDSATTHTAHDTNKAPPAALSLGARGVVFGDIGTSPLYTLKECMTAAGGAKAGVEDLFGMLSLMFWSLVMVVTVKYLTFVMRAENHGEGGIFALLAIVPERFRATAAPGGKITGRHARRPQTFRSSHGYMVCDLVRPGNISHQPPSGNPRCAVSAPWGGILPSSWTARRPDTRLRRTGGDW